MELRHLRYAVAIADELHFTRAAEKLGIGQPPLSQQIKLLEEEIGVRLFYRKTRGVELTEAGRAFLPHARAALLEASQSISAAQRAARGESGSITVGFTGSASFNPIIPAAITRFREQYPHLVVHLVEEASTRLIARLRGDTLDIAFLRPEPGGMDGLFSRCIATERLCAALPRTHRLAANPVVDLAALAKEPFVMYPRSNGTLLYDAIMAACIAAGFSPDVAQEAPQMTSAVNLVAAGVGVAVVPASLERVRSDEVSYAMLSDENASIDLHVVYNAVGATPPAVRNFMSSLSGLL